MKIITTKTRATLRKLVAACKADGLQNVVSNEKVRKHGESWAVSFGEAPTLTRKVAKKRFNVVNGLAVAG